MRGHLQRLTVETLSERKHSAILNDLDRFHKVQILSTDMLDHPLRHK